MSFKITTTLAAAAVGLLLANGYAVAGEALKLGGSVAVGKGVIIANQAAIEEETGLTLDITVNGDAGGLKQLNAGEVDVAMLGAAYEMAVSSVNEAAPGSFNAADFVASPIGSASLNFIVHPSNPVKDLTEQQIKDIFTGKVVNWSEVGGPDQPILVVAGAPGLGARNSVVKLFLDGVEITDQAKAMQQLVQVTQVVAQAPNAIGFGNSGSINDTVAIVPGVEVTQVLSLVTRGAPNENAQKLIDASTKYAAAKK
jgi:phosphate transport system substrate-binding protein